jgi:signal transduction histidine kinase/CheY-like chemotaxis protein
MELPHLQNIHASKPEINIYDQLRSFRAEIVRRTALAFVLITGTSAWLVLSTYPFPLWTFLVLVLLFCLGLTVYNISVDHPSRARYLMFCIALFGPIALMLVSTEQWIPFIILPFVFIGSIVVNRGEVILGGIFAASILLLNILGWREYHIQGFTLALVLTVSLSWVVIYMVNTSLSWYQSMLDQSNKLLHETRDHRGELSKAVKALKLATDLQRRTEQELILARRSSEEARFMKERFAARVSHELRTPMALIHGFSEVMYNSPEIYGDVTWTPTMRRDIAQIYRNSRHMLSMMDDILNLSQFELTGFAINLEDTSIAALVSEAASISRNLFNNPKVIFEVDYPPDLPVLKVDRTRIRQVILNLVNNAKRFTEEGYVRLSVTQNAHEVILCVSDTGPGIPPDKLEMIFQEFYQVDETVLRNKGGTGLGLTISKNFVEIHGGHIWAESVLGEGSSFYFSLPQLAPFVQSSLLDASRAEEISPDLPRLIVLGADEYVHAMLRAAFTEYEIILVASTARLEQAVSLYHPLAVLVNRAPDSSEEISCEIDLSIPVIYFSLPSTRWLVDRLGLHTCLAKPITGEQIEREIGRLSNINRILVIDDDTEFLQLVERLLQAYNPELEIITANFGRMGLNMAASKKPDLVFLDLSMPDVDGFYVIEQMKNDPILAAVPVILVTADTHPERIYSWTDNKILIQRHGELHMLETVNLLKSALAVLKPNYHESTDDILTKLKTS